MNVVCNWGIQGILPQDFTKDQVIGNLRLLVRLGFTDRIIEVVNGKVLEFTFAKGEVQMDEMEENANYFRNGNLIGSIWDDGFEGVVSEKFWKQISPECASVFLPSEKDFFEQLDNISGPPVYIDSIGNVLERIDTLLAETPPGMNDDFRETLDHYRKVFYTALKFSFIVTITA